MRSHRYFVGPESAVARFTYLRMADYTISISNTMNAFLDAQERLATATTLLKNEDAWLAWDAILRQKASTFYEILTATVDDLGRASIEDSPVKKEYKALQKAIATAHVPYDDYGASVRTAILKQCSSETIAAPASLSSVYAPALVTPKFYIRLSSLAFQRDTNVSKFALFGCPGLGQQFCKQLTVATATIDQGRWLTGLLASLTDSKTLEGVASTDRMLYDLIQKRLMCQNAMTLWLLYAIQPLVLHAQFMLPVLQRIQLMHEACSPEDDELVGRGRNVIDAITSIAALPLFELWRPTASLNRAAITVDSIFGERSALFLPGVWMGRNLTDAVKESSTEEAGPIDCSAFSVLPIDCSLLDNVKSTDSEHGVSFDDRGIDLVYCWRSYLTALAVQPQMPRTFDTLTSDKGWLDWRTVARVLSSHVGMGESMAKVTTNIGWSGSNTMDLGAITVDGRGADFCFTDTKHYQRNVWQVLCGVTPALPLNNRKAFRRSLRTENEFGVKAGTINWSIVSYTGHFGDVLGGRISERHVIPACSNCNEPADRVEDLVADKPVAAAYYASLMPLIIRRRYVVAGKVSPLKNVNYHHDSWEATFEVHITEANRASLKAPYDLAMTQYSKEVEPVSTAEFCESEEGFAKRGPVLCAHRRSTFLVDSFGRIRVEVADPGTVVWDEDSNTNVEIDGSSIAPIDSLLSFMDDRLNLSSRGGVDLANGVKLETD